jgi:methylmalonyl-CoA/ethylmalonyl-CoA epimerase
MTLPIEPMNGSDERQSTDSLFESAWPSFIGRARLHHLGVVVQSISASAEEFAASMSASWSGQIIHDPLQRVRVAFFAPANPRNPVFELVEPAGEGSPVTNFLSKRVGLHHICYEIDDLESGLRAASGAGYVVTSTPKPAVAFDGRRIAWVSSKTRLLMELLERDGTRTEVDLADREIPSV